MRKKKRGNKLSDEQVLEIFKSLWPYPVLAAMYKVSVPLICQIKTGGRWNSVTGLPYRNRGKVS